MDLVPFDVCSEAQCDETVQTYTKSAVIHVVRDCKVNERSKVPRSCQYDSKGRIVNHLLGRGTKTSRSSTTIVPG